MKKVLITGGATGIGKATALLFKQKGYDVFITYNQSEPDFDGITKIKCNLENENEIIELFNQIKSIDVLVNNAGISLIKQINDTTAEEYDKIMRINARSYFLCSREAVKLMLKSHSGAIVNVSSMWGAAWCIVRNCIFNEQSGNNRIKSFSCAGACAKRHNRKLRLPRNN